MNQAPDWFNKTYVFRRSWRKSVVSMTSAYSDSSRVDHFAGWIKVTEAQIIQVPEVRCRVLQLLDLVVVKDDWIEDVRKHVIGVRVRGVDTAVTLQMFATCNTGTEESGHLMDQTPPRLIT